MLEQIKTKNWKIRASRSFLYHLETDVPWDCLKYSSRDSENRWILGILDFRFLINQTANMDHCRCDKDKKCSSQWVYKQKRKTSVTSMIAEFSAVHIHRKQTRKLGFIQWAGTEDTMTDSCLKRSPTALVHYY